jgi:hypothetical protein
MQWNGSVFSAASQENRMKKIALLLVAAAAGLAGCVAVPYDNGPPPHRAHPHHGDRDRDGVPNRADRDRDGDGVRNRNDRRPNDPRRY